MKNLQIMKGLKTIDTVPLNKGMLHIVELPEGFADVVDPRKALLNQAVILDGRCVEVIGVEAHAVSWPHESLNKVGLLIESPEKAKFRSYLAEMGR